MSQALVIFKAINNSEQQQVLLQNLLADQIPVSLRISEHFQLELSPMSINSSLQLKCQYQGNDLPEDAPRVLMMNFNLNSEKYMAEVQARLKGTLLSLSVLNLFHLQRRRNFRYILPPNHPGFFRVKTMGTKVIQTTLRLIDISTEGCAVQMSDQHLDMNVGDELTGEIVLEGQKSILVTALLQNIRANEDQTLTLGIKFVHTAQNREGDIVQALTLLQRSLFLKRAA